MNEPDTRFGTSSGQHETTSGQTQDNADADLPFEKQLELDLRDLVSFGSGLTRAKCQRLRALPHLDHVLLVAGLTSPNKPPDPTSPVTLQRVLEAAIDRLAMSPAEYAAEYAQTGRLLFGLAKETRGLRGDPRRKIALKYYNDHLNFRGDDVAMTNFKRRVCEQEILAPLVRLLQEWEDDLKRVPAIELSSQALLHWWRTVYWVLFRVQDHLRLAANCSDGYLVWVKTQNPWELLPPEPAMPEESDDDRANRTMMSALFHVTVVLRFARSERTAAARLPFLPDIIGDLYRHIGDYFVFSEPDQAWLDREVDTVASTLTGQFPWDGSQEFFSSIDNDPRGRLVLRKFLTLADECNKCKLSSLSEQAKLFGGFESVDWDSVVKKVCPLHKLSIYAHRLDRELPTQWIAVARAFGGWTGFAGAIPPPA